MNYKYFSLRRHERPVFLFALLLAIVLQAIIICRYNDIFTNPGPKYWAVFLHNFSVSGYDPITYSVVTDWTAKYNVYRHPLLAFFMAPLYWLNLGLTALTGVNCVQYVVAFFWILATAYAFLFFYRIVLAILIGSEGPSDGSIAAAQRSKFNVQTPSDGSNSTLNCATGALSTAPQAQAMLLSSLLFSFGHVLLAGMAPDHFILSMMMLLLLLLVSLEKLQQQRPFTIAEALIFFIIIAGITLSNGVKVFICVLLVNWLTLSPTRNKRSSNDVETQTARVSIPLLNGRGRGVGLVFLSLLFASALLWGIARAEYHYLVLPQEKIAHAKKAADKKRKQEAAARRKAEAEKTFQMLIDQAQATGDTSLFAQATHRLDSVRTAKPKVRRNPYGKPIAKGEFMRWTDITTSRSSSAVENLFGEGIQLHRDYALGDVLRHRPVIVNYRSPVQYIIEAFILLLFLAGVWFGRRSRFLWIALACAAFDMLLHLGLGFGLNEVYIMSAHWIFVLPLAMTFLFKNLAPSLRVRLGSLEQPPMWLRPHKGEQIPHLRRRTVGVGLLLLLLCLYLYIWNFVIIFQEMT